MHCQSCGQKLRSTARFCNGCGNSVAERFGSALLVTPPSSKEATSPDTPTENLAPKTRTARNPAAVSTQEGQAMPSTDQLGLRGTGRQSAPKITSEEAAPKSAELRTTVVDAKAFKELAPTRPATPTQIEAAQMKPVAAKAAEAPAFVPPPPPVALAAASAAPPKAAAPAALENQSIEFVAPSTKELQQSVANKPFFTRMLTPNAKNPQHRYLIFAVPLVLLAALVVLIIFLWQR